MRSKKAKKPLLNVKVVTTSKENYDEEKESKTNPEEKKRLEDEIMKKANEDDKQKKVAETKKNEQKEEIVLILKKQGDYNGLTPLEIQRSSDKLMQFSLHKISGLLGELREEGKITQYEDAKGRVISVIAVTNKETDDSKKETKFNLEEEKQLKYDAVKKIKESNERKKVAETEKNEQKEEIVLILKKQGDYNGLTPLEIQRSSDKLMQFSLHKISGLLRELREEGKIIQYEDAKGRVISQLV
jgi:hypothetical protein